MRRCVRMGAAVGMRGGDDAPELACLQTKTPQLAQHARPTKRRTFLAENTAHGSFGRSLHGMMGLTHYPPQSNPPH